MSSHPAGSPKHLAEIERLQRVNRIADSSSLAPIDVLIAIPRTPGDGPVELSILKGRTRTTPTPELIGSVLRRTHAELGALLDYTDAAGAWRARATLAHRVLGRAIASLSTEGIETESDNENEPT